MSMNDTMGSPRLPRSRSSLQLLLLLREAVDSITTSREKLEAVQAAWGLDSMSGDRVDTLWLPPQPTSPDESTSGTWVVKWTRPPPSPPTSSPRWSAQLSQWWDRELIRQSLLAPATPRLPASQE